MVVSDSTFIDAFLSWLASRKAARLKARKKRAAAIAKRQATQAQRPKRKAGKRPKRIVTAAQHRRHYGKPPALRVIEGGKA